MSRRGRPSLEDLLARVQAQVDLLHADYGGLPRAVEADEILREIWLEDTFHSSKLEGNPLSKRQVRRVVEEGEAQGPLSDVLEVQGYSTAARWVYRTAPDYDLQVGVPFEVIRHVHQLLMGPAWQISPFSDGSKPGEFREQPIQIAGSTVRTTPPAAIASEVAAWVDRTAQAGATDLGAVAELHAAFERLHPFADGNGRVGRLLMNFMLVQRCYPPAVLVSTARSRYLAALARADSGNAGSLTELVARAIEDSINRFLIPKLAGEARLVPLPALTDYSGYAPGYLRSLAAQGRLRAVREGRIWLSSRRWVDDYKASRSPRGRRARAG